MKKLLSIFSALALALPLFAGVVTFKPGDFSGQGTSGTGGAVSATKNGVTFACDKAFGSSSALRCYKNSVVNVTSDSKISTIEFAFETASGQTYDGGLEASVTVDGLTWNHTLEFQARFTEIKVNIAGDVPEETVDTISVTQALARLAEGKTGECYVKGKVSKIMTSGVETYGNISYWMHDLDNANDSIQAYRMFGAGNKQYTSSADIEFVVGDEILVYGSGLAMYHNNNTNTDIPEINGGYFFRKISGKPSEKLDWADGLAVFFEDHWQLEISKNDKNALTLIFSSDKEHSIAGHHYLAQGSSIKVNGKEADITSGFVQLTFKEVSTGGYNVYTTQVSAITDDKVYVIANDIEFMAVADDYETEIDLSEDRPFVPTEGQIVTCEQARSYALSLQDNTEGDITFSVEGYVTDVFSDGQSFWIDDAQGSKKTFEIYKFKKWESAGIALTKDIKIRATGHAKRYGDTPEMVNAVVEVIEGGEELVGEETVDVAGALAVAQALEPNKTTTKVYDIIGFVSEIVYPYAEDKGITFWMSDNATDGAQTFEAYQVQCKPEVAAKIEVGVKVKVTARITHFHQDAKPATDTEEAKPERTVYETAKGGIVKFLNGAGVEVITNDAAAVKFIENGQLYILRGNAQYNVQGQLVK